MVVAVVVAAFVLYISSCCLFFSFKNYKLHKLDIVSGPTTSAGAIGRVAVVSDYHMMRSNEVENDEGIGPIEEMANNNDSYNFYRLLNNGKYHVITGHTGTNVMDLHILYIPPFNSNCAHKL